MSATPSIADMAAAHRLFSVLTVCTANLCRSPAMQALLADAVTTGPAASGRWEVASAGTDADDGRAAHPLAIRALAERGHRLPDGWVSHRLTADRIARADLVLTATRRHRGVVVGLDPTAADRTFTLRQFGRLVIAGRDWLLPDAPGHPGDDLLAAARAGRGRSVVADPLADDLADPIGRPFAAYEVMVGDILGVADPLLAPLTAAAPRS